MSQGGSPSTTAAIARLDGVADGVIVTLRAGTDFDSTAAEIRALDGVLTVERA